MSEIEPKETGRKDKDFIFLRIEIDDQPIVFIIRPQNGKVYQMRQELNGIRFIVTPTKIDTKPPDKNTALNNRC